MKKRVIAVLASDINGGIGVGNKLPWKKSEDLKRFKELTTGTICIMGRNTFESLHMPNGLPNRLNLVVSTTLSPDEFDSDSKKCFSSFEEAMEYANLQNGYETISLIGGKDIFMRAMSGTADEIFFTVIMDIYPECDTFVDINQMSARYVTVDVEAFYDEGGCLFSHNIRADLIETPPEGLRITTSGKGA